MVRITRITLSFLMSALALGSGVAHATDWAPPVDETVDWHKVKVVYNVPNRDRAVFITIDDGGAAPPSFGRWLDENRIPVTNFVMPEMLHLNRGWYRERKFMTFENHTNTHAHMTLSTLDEQTKEICRANRLIEGIVKEKPVLYRPPRGSFNANSRRAAAACGIRYIVMWSAMADGGVIRTPGNRPLKAGDIIILHYNGGLPGSMAHLLATIERNGLKPAFLRDYLR
ncbi:MAG: hypothetical protein RLZZ254_328 [Actinomycetota bacterium]|jgi:peptidoglycan/xylan/chitin deacetylase (PgdA/CDA1 family)